MVPTLALGIPGSGTTALILAALVMHGFRPGPYLITETPDMVYAIFGAMLIANCWFFRNRTCWSKIFLFGYLYTKKIFMAICFHFFSNRILCLQLSFFRCVGYVNLRYRWFFMMKTRFFSSSISNGSYFRTYGRRNVYSSDGYS